MVIIDTDVLIEVARGNQQVIANTTKRAKKIYALRPLPMPNL